MKTDNFARRHRAVMVWIGFLVLVLPIFACGPGGNGTETAPDAQVRREASRVFAGSSSASVLPELADSQFHTLEDGDRVTTDSVGEALLQIRDCLRIFLFQQSGLVKAACPKSDFAAGNALCSLAGTSVFNNQCAGQVVIQTNTAEINLNGTWLSVTYLPERELSLVMVLEGEAECRAVVDPDSRRMGSASTVPSDSFWFTTPGAGADTVAGFSARQVYPLEAVGPMLDTLDLWPWWERMEQRAGADEIPFPELGEPGSSGGTQPVDRTPPEVFVSHEPGNPSDQDQVRFIVEAYDDAGVERIELNVDGEWVHSCTGSEICEYEGGPYPAGRVDYRAVAFDPEGNQGASERGFVSIGAAEQRIAGQITWNGEPVPEIAVELLPGPCSNDRYKTLYAAGEAPELTFTDGDGAYEFSGPEPGDYALIVNGWWNPDLRQEPYGGACYPDYRLNTGQNLQVDFDLYKTDLAIVAPKGNATIGRYDTEFRWQPYRSADRYEVILIKEEPVRETILWQEPTDGTAYVLDQPLERGASYQLIVWAYSGNNQIANGSIRFNVAEAVID